MVCEAAALWVSNTLDTQGSGCAVHGALLASGCATGMLLGAASLHSLHSASDGTQQPSFLLLRCAGRGCGRTTPCLPRCSCCARGRGLLTAQWTCGRRCKKWVVYMCMCLDAVWVWWFRVMSWNELDPSGLEDRRRCPRACDVRQVARSRVGPWRAVGAADRRACLRQLLAPPRPC